LARACLVMG